jgi:hypothetical protein
MKSKQFTLGLMALILSQLLSLKTVAQCCVAPVNLTEQTTILYSDPPLIIRVGSVAVYRWQRVQQAGCTTPVKYKIKWHFVGEPDSLWFTKIVTTAPDASFVDYMDTCKEKCCPSGNCFSETSIEWRVRGICSGTNKSDWVHGPDFKLVSSASVTTSSASDASSQGKFTVTAYPNPVAGELNLSGNLKAGGPVTIQIINSVGQTVLREDHNFNSGNFNTGIDVSKLPPGVYLVIVNDKAERATLSIIKQ